MNERGNIISGPLKEGKESLMDMIRTEAYFIWQRRTELGVYKADDPVVNWLIAEHRIKRLWR